MINDTELVTHGDLPHWYKPGHAHFVTYRLFDSIPVVRLKQWREERQLTIDRDSSRTPKILDAGSVPHVGDAASIPGARSIRELAHKRFYQKYDQFLDQHPKKRWLEQPDVANIIRENLYHHNQHLYELISWCVMPNHVHILIQPLEKGIARSFNRLNESSIDVQSDEISDQKCVLSRIMHSLKSYTANQINLILGRTGRLWQRESYDHWVRDLDELERIVEYIRMNPVKAGLCNSSEQWKFSSAFDRHQRDGSTCAMVGWLRDNWRG